MLTKLNLHEIYTGNDDINGEDYNVEDIDGSPGAFRCFLDVGLAKTSTGARLFGALKGALDGGLDIPHRFGHYKSSFICGSVIRMSCVQIVIRTQCLLFFDIFVMYRVTFLLQCEAFPWV